MRRLTQSMTCSRFAPTVIRKDHGPMAVRTWSAGRSYSAGRVRSVSLQGAKHLEKIEAYRFTGVSMKSSSRARERAFKSQNGLCHYCGRPMAPSADWPHRLACTAEHLVAKSDGGGNGPENIVAAHAFCNRVRHARKHPMSQPEYLKHVQRRVAAGKWLRIPGRKARSSQPVIVSNVRPSPHPARESNSP